ncbi:recombinase RecT [Salinimonas marina]|uniref:Recombinase RecT n=2 Tax=Salinimonas marina TaxID=2785918 RepID=A0A7S9E056_9ALTE|nr:recombinase RecT [Salinimonas marina]
MGGDLSLANPMANMMMNAQYMSMVEKYADYMASGVSTVPNHLRGNKADCFAITMQALRWGLDPFVVGQKTCLINGVLGYEAQLVTAVLQTSGRITGSFHYDWFGAWEKILGKFTTKTNQSGKPYKVPAWSDKDEDGLGITISATLRGESEPRELTLLLTQAQVRNSTLWAADPKQQLAYLASKRFARLYCPEAILGVYTADELEPAGIKDINPAPSKATKKAAAKAVVEKYTEEVASEELSGLAVDFLSAIEGTESLMELEKVTGEVTGAIETGAVSDFERSHLLDAYKRRKKALTAAAADTNE